ncbi:hypothetical protein J4418_01720 [Candidatus Woesearchaeota archaeon]|nr:hypothetical protein [Candidatus Woesearchaeota archaeon]
MDELEQLRQQRITQLQAQSQNEAAEEQQALQQIQQIEFAVKSKMTRDAVSRYSILKSAHPEKAIQTLMVLAQAIQTKQVNFIEDDYLKELLSKINSEKKDFKITRK